MKRKTWLLHLSLLLSLGVTPSARAQVNTAFTYQGRLTENDVPANGSYSFQLSLWDALVLGTQIGGAITVEPVPVMNGLFTVTLDFGANAFNSSDRWLQVAVRAVETTPGPYSV